MRSSNFGVEVAAASEGVDMVEANANNKVNEARCLMHSLQKIEARTGVTYFMHPVFLARSMSRIRGNSSLQQAINYCTPGTCCFAWGGFSHNFSGCVSRGPAAVVDPNNGACSGLSVLIARYLT